MCRQGRRFYHLKHPAKRRKEWLETAAGNKKKVRYEYLNSTAFQLVTERGSPSFFIRSTCTRAGVDSENREYEIYFRFTEN